MKTYLGDGVTVEWGGMGLVITTSDGRRVTNTIVLEPSTYNALLAFVSELRARVKATAPRKAAQGE